MLLVTLTPFVLILSKDRSSLEGKNGLRQAPPERMMDFLMTATPAWPPQSAPRLHVETQLGEGVSVPVAGNPAHYLISVMRVKADDLVLLFDDRSGDWAAKARDIRKRDLVLEVAIGRASCRERVCQYV